MREKIQFIWKSKYKNTLFVLQNVTEKPEPDGTDPRNKTQSVSDTARDLATLHHICVSHLRELQALSKTQVCHPIKRYTPKKLA